MWVFSVYGFYSIASADKEGVTPRQIDPNKVMVRARVRLHLESLQERFPFLKQYPILEWDDRDYGFRIICPKKDWVLALTEMAEEQEWSNFKDEAHHNQVDVGSAYISALHRVWSVMLSLQPYKRWWKSNTETLDEYAEINGKQKKLRRKKGDGRPPLPWKACKTCGHETLQECGVCIMCQQTAEETTERFDTVD